MRLKNNFNLFLIKIGLKKKWTYEEIMYVLDNPKLIEVLGTRINANPLYWRYCPYCKKKLEKDVQPQLYGIWCPKCHIWYKIIADYKLADYEEKLRERKALLDKYKKAKTKVKPNDEKQEL